MSVETINIESSVERIPSRDVHIYLPPDYNPAKPDGYPVLYMHDGQNVFQPGTEFGCWNAEMVADKEIALGRLPPFIIVAVDNDSENRGLEYVPPNGEYKNFGPGIANLYQQFITDNVIPNIKSRYNITEDRKKTMIAGASLGGVISLYIGLNTDQFGAIGSMSTAICWAEAFLDNIPNVDTSNVRIYHDVGTGEYEEMAPDNYDTMPKRLHENLKRSGLKEPHDLKFMISEGALHNESAWYVRLPDMLKWMMSV